MPGMEDGADPDSGSSSRLTPANAPVDLIAITESDDLLIVISEALPNQGVVHPVESAAAAVELLSSTNRGQVLIVDARNRENVRAELEQVLETAPHVVPLLVVPAQTRRELTAEVRGLPLRAVLTMPLDARELTPVLESAMTEAAAAAAVAGRPRHSTRRTTSASEPAPAGPAEDRSGSSRALILASVVLALGGAAGGYLALRHTTQPAAGSAAGAAEAPEGQAVPLVQGKMDDLLEKARAAMRARRFTTPANDNALLYYRSAAAADPTSAEARDGLQRVAAVLLARLEEALTDGHAEDAGSALNDLKLAIPNDPRLPDLTVRVASARIAKAQSEGNVDRAATLVRQAEVSGLVPAEQIKQWRAELAHRQEDLKLQHLARLVADSIRDGRLLEPAATSARGYLKQLAAVAPGHPMTIQATRELNAAYLRKAREAVQARNAPDVERWLQEARNGGASPAQIEAVRRDVGAAQKQMEIDGLVEQLKEHLRAGKLTEPPQDNAAYYLSQLQTKDPNHAAIAPANRELAARLLERARGLINQGRSAPADADIAQARRYGADPKEITALQELAASLAAPQVAGTTSSSSASVVSAGANLGTPQPRRITYIPPDYPLAAMANNQSGHVKVSFIVDVRGQPRDVKVLESSPPGVFDRSVISAIRRWRYEPPMVDGRPVEAPLTADIKFTKPK